MPTSDSTQILLSHDKWATKNVIDACHQLGIEEFHREFEMGPGSLHHTITHILGAMHGWTDLLAQRDPRPRISTDETRTIDKLAEMHEDISTEFSEWAMNFSPDELVSGERGGKMFTFARGAVVTHVTTHGMHHRAQCLNMLRQLGVSKLPSSSVVEWIMMVDANPGN